MVLVLWSSVPGAELLRRSEAGALDDSARLAAEARRMTADARFRRSAREFVRQWLRLDSLVIRKLTAGGKACGGPMPITGGRRTLNATEHACFVRWVEGVARTGTPLPLPAARGEGKPLR